MSQVTKHAIKWPAINSPALVRRHVVAGMAALGIATLVRGGAAAQTVSAPSPIRPLAERLAAYAHALRYDDLDAATIERVKSHVIDTIGCGLAAFDEEPVRICRDVALAATGAPQP
jgi:2-methylcitrate dehydratase